MNLVMKLSSYNLVFATKILHCASKIKLVLLLPNDFPPQKTLCT